MLYWQGLLSQEYFSIHIFNDFFFFFFCMYMKISNNVLTIKICEYSLIHTYNWNSKDNLLSKQIFLLQFFFSFLTFVFGNRIFSWFDSPDSKNQNQNWTNSKPTAISRKILYTEYILELVLFIIELRQKFYSSSFFWRAITLWNRLLRICFQDHSNPNLFKSRINLYLTYISS